MKIQLNNGIISDLSLTAVIATNAGDVEVDNVPSQPFDYDFIDGEFVRMRWSDWHDQNSSFQIKITHFDNANMLKKYPDMALYASVLPCVIEPDYIYLYAGFINTPDYLRLTEFNAEIYNKKGERV